MVNNFILCYQQTILDRNAGLSIGLVAAEVKPSAYPRARVGAYCGGGTMDRKNTWLIESQLGPIALGLGRGRTEQMSVVVGWLHPEIGADGRYPTMEGTGNTI